MTEVYNSNKSYTGVNFTGSIDKGTGVTWRSREDQQRVKDYENAQKLYDGIHVVNEGGVFRHPYPNKANEIQYQQINLLAKASRAYADLIVGDGVILKSEESTIQDLLDLQDSYLLWEALIQASKFGFCGLQPQFKHNIEDKRRKIRNKETFTNGYFSFSVIRPEVLYPEWHPVRDEITKIRKCLIFNNIRVTTETIDILFEETHYKDRIENRLYQINREEIIQELPLDFFEYLLPDEQPPLPVWVHNLGDFYITLVFNIKIGRDIYSDYTETALKLQRGVNDRMTQIDRILGLHADPRLIAPYSALKKDEKTGEYFFAYKGKEILCYDDGKMGNADAFKLLTWNGELSQAVADRDNKILSFLTETDIAPQLLSFTHLIGGTVSETAEKLKRMLHSTLKRGEKKRDFLWEALWVLLVNIVKLMDNRGVAISATDNFSIHFPDMVPRLRDELINEAITRKQNGLITTEDALQLIDDLNETDASAKSVKIFNEAANSVQNPFSMGNPAFPWEGES